jgi:hypothetical protein
MSSDGSGAFSEGQNDPKFSRIWGNGSFWGESGTQHGSPVRTQLLSAISQAARVPVNHHNSLLYNELQIFFIRRLNFMNKQ